MDKNFLRSLPPVDRLLSSPEAEKLMETHGRSPVIHEMRLILNQIRTKILEDRMPSPFKRPDLEPWILKQAALRLQKRLSPSLKKAINATGVVLHTGLGRAVMPPSAVDAVNQIITGYCTLATDIETGRRGHRDIHLNELLCSLTGAEAATVVNNNAAATMLILNTLAKGKEVILSRGQLVEIGGSFRMPDVMETSGSFLREVGTTNKTHLQDYAAAINENTGAIMRVHHSNYRILGFASEPGIQELTALAHEHGLLMIDDLGSGSLIDLKTFGLESEPLVRDSIQTGADVACFSGDKLIGGPQAGVIIGRRNIIRAIAQNPLTRAFRIGKMTIAGLDAALRLFIHPEALASRHPVYRMLSVPVKILKKRAGRFIKKCRLLLPEEVRLSIVEGQSQVGSGSVPVETIPSVLLEISSPLSSAEEIARSLRKNAPPIFSRIQKDAVLLDFRTIQENEEPLVLKALTTVFKEEAAAHV